MIILAILILVYIIGFFAFSVWLIRYSDVHTDAPESFFMSAIWPILIPFCLLALGWVKFHTWLKDLPY